MYFVVVVVIWITITSAVDCVESLIPKCPIMYWWEIAVPTHSLQLTAVIPKCIVHQVMESVYCMSG